MKPAKAIRRSLERAASEWGVDIGDTFADGAKHANVGAVFAYAAQCRITSGQLDAALGLKVDVSDGQLQRLADLDQPAHPHVALALENSDEGRLTQPG